MKNHAAPPLRRILLAWIAASLASPTAFADSEKSFGTKQSRFVQAAIEALDGGDEDSLNRFRSMLTGDALTLYGSPEGMMSLKKHLKNALPDLRALNTRSDVEGKWKGDRGVLVASRSYSVDVLARKGDGDAFDSVWNASVECDTLSLTESFGGPMLNCRISELSISAKTREGQTTSQRAPAIFSQAARKELGADDRIVPADAEKSALSAGTSR